MSNETKSIIRLVQVFMCVLTCALNAVASLYIWDQPWQEYRLYCTDFRTLPRCAKLELRNFDSSSYA